MPCEFLFLVGFYQLIFYDFISCYSYGYKLKEVSFKIASFQILISRPGIAIN